MSERAEVVLGAVRLVLRDFQRPTPVRLRPRVDERRGREELISVGSTGFWVQGDHVGEQLLVDIAYFLQDQVFDQLEQTWGEARPPCPGHPHPPDPVLLDGEASWRCPLTEERLGRIGELHPT